MLPLPPNVRVFDQLPRLHEAAAGIVVAAAENAVRRRGGFQLGLSGGRTPRGFYELLAVAPWRERIDWTRTHIWFSDERCVPPEHPESNYQMAQQALLARVPVPSQQVHRMRGEIDPPAAARSYEAELRAAGGRLDLLLLGMGADGHTASLFPGAAQLHERRRLVVAAVGPAAPRERVTLTLAAIRAARRIVMLVAGAEKAQALQAALQGSPHARRARFASERAGDGAGGGTLVPAALVRGGRGARPLWLVDRAAVAG